MDTYTSTSTALPRKNKDKNKNNNTPTVYNQLPRKLSRGKTLQEPNYKGQLQKNDLNIFNEIDDDILILLPNSSKQFRKSMRWKKTPAVNSYYTYGAPHVIIYKIAHAACASRMQCKKLTRIPRYSTSIKKKKNGKRNAMQCSYLPWPKHPTASYTPDTAYSSLTVTNHSPLTTRAITRRHASPGKPFHPSPFRFDNFQRCLLQRILTLAQRQSRRSPCKPHRPV